MTLGQLRKTIRTADELGELVGTMETLAAVNIRQYESTVRAIDTYVHTIELGFQIVLRHAPELLQIGTGDGSRVGLIVFGSDQGLCGSINSRATECALARIGEVKQTRTVAVGHRVAQGLTDQGIEIEAELRPPHAVSGITALVAELLDTLGTWQDEGSVDELVVVFNTPRMSERKQGRSGRIMSGFDTNAQTMLPLESGWLAELSQRPWDSRRQPTFSDDPDALFSWLVQEWLFSRIYLACASSLAAENASRLEATQAAGRSIEERLRELRMEYRSLRQTSITEELLDLYR